MKLIYVVAFAGAGAVTVAILALLFNIQQRKAEAFQYPMNVVEIAENELDPAVWGRNFPLEYDTFIKTEIDDGKTEFGGSTPYSKLEAVPAMKRLWAGYAFAIDHNEERGHYYTAIDQANTQRVKIV
ncbi:ammonia-forming cytochrome c nitrite reductase subunit c552, partial [bacterium]|nr:ammonia-forming cytochrome c nitrite reductase subunit c552 [bacterium]